MRMTPEEKERYDRIDRQLEFLADTVQRLARDVEDRGRRTDERIATLISKVEKNFSNGEK